MHWDEDDSSKDRLLRDYDTILKESAVLTTFAGVLFGFLLIYPSETQSINIPRKNRDCFGIIFYNYRSLILCYAGNLSSFAISL